MPRSYFVPSAEKSVTPGDKTVFPAMISADNKPISQFEELGDRIVADTTSSRDSASQKRNKRKASSVKHVTANNPTYEDTPCKMPKHESMIPGNYTQNFRNQQASSRTEKEPGTQGGIHRDTGAYSRSNMQQNKTTVYGAYPKHKSCGRLSSSCRPEDIPRETLPKTNQNTDLLHRPTMPRHTGAGPPDPQKYIRKYVYSLHATD